LYYSTRSSGEPLPDGTFDSSAPQWQDESASSLHLKWSHRFMFSRFACFFNAIPPALAIAVVVPAFVLAHGDSEPGPNGGEIRMPGAFHLEAVPGESAVHVYLLDMQFQNPEVDDSSVTATLRQDGEQWSIDCRIAGVAEYFRCPLPSGVDLDRGQLHIDASRGGVPGDSARYELPLMRGNDAETSG
jgi:hypothetical protein